MPASSTGRWTYPKSKPTPGKRCKDCVAEGITTVRPAPHPGTRCTTHWNAEKRRKRLARSVKHVETTYQLSPADYDALYAFQGGRCALCRRATGASKRLAVDHDHRQALLDGHDPNKGCPKCCRGLVDSVCNDILSHARDDPAFGLRLAAYLTLWPMKRMLKKMVWPPRDLV